MSYQVSLFYTMYLYNVHYWISFPSYAATNLRYPFSFQPFMPPSSSLFIQVKLDTAPYEPPFTTADKKELQPNFSLSRDIPSETAMSDTAYYRRRSKHILSISNSWLQSRQWQCAVQGYDLSPKAAKELGTNLDETGQHMFWCIEVRISASLYADADTL